MKLPASENLESLGQLQVRPQVLTPLVYLCLEKIDSKVPIGGDPYPFEVRPWCDTNRREVSHNIPELHFPEQLV